MKIWIFLAVLALEDAPGMMHTPVTFFAEEKACKVLQAVFETTHEVGKLDPDQGKRILAKQSWCWRFDGPPLGEPA